MRVLNKDETHLLYSLVFGGGVVNDATSVVLFNAIQGSDLSPIDSSVAFSVNWQRLVLTHLQYHAWVFWYVVSLFFVSILASRLMIQFYLFIILLPSSKNPIGKSHPLQDLHLAASGQWTWPRDWSNRWRVELPRPTSLPMILCAPSHTVHNYWRKYDVALMGPVIGGQGFVPRIPISPTDKRWWPLVGTN